MHCKAGKNDEKLHLETLSPVVMRHNPSEVRLNLGLDLSS